MFLSFKGGMTFEVSQNKEIPLRKENRWRSEIISVISLGRAIGRNVDV